MKKIFLTERFYWLLGTVIALFAISFALQFLFYIAQLALLVFVAVLFIDVFLVFRKGKLIQARRETSQQWGLGDLQKVLISVDNLDNNTWAIQLFDELPIQFQERKFNMEFQLKAFESKNLEYEVLPKERGVYSFGDIRVYVASPIAIVQRRIDVDQQSDSKVYPSLLQMRNMELLAFSKISTMEGVKKLRRIGHNYEFEQIKNYTLGDDIRSINWRATGKRNDLMVNQYQDERAQQVYLIIDKSRAMSLQFNKQSYLDYAINTSLVIANIALKKYDKAGLITFSDKIGASLRAERSKLQLRKIMEQLYKEKASELESSYPLLMQLCRRMLRGRSLLFLFANFESQNALERVIPVLRKLNKLHLLVLIFFEDAEIKDFEREEALDVEGIYQHALAGQYLAQKKNMHLLLQKQGIQSILTSPERLSMDTLNKYLELKAKGLI